MSDKLKPASRAQIDAINDMFSAGIQEFCYYDKLSVFCDAQIPALNEDLILQVALPHLHLHVYGYRIVKSLKLQQILLQ